MVAAPIEQHRTGMHPCVSKDFQHAALRFRVTFMYALHLLIILRFRRSRILSHIWVTIGGVWIGEWIY
jgi:hypothetical protein